MLTNAVGPPIKFIGPVAGALTAAPRKGLLPLRASLLLPESQEPRNRGGQCRKPHYGRIGIEIQAVRVSAG